MREGAAVCYFLGDKRPQKCERSALSYENKDYCLVVILRMQRVICLGYFYEVVWIYYFWELLHFLQQFSGGHLHAVESKPLFAEVFD